MVNSKRLKNRGLSLATLAVEVADRLGLPPSQTTAVWLAAMVHGLEGVEAMPPAAFKPGPLTSEVRQMVLSHLARAAESVQGLPEAATIVAHHHERLDGTGCPGKVRGEQLPLAAQVVGLAEFYESLIDACSRAQALTAIRLDIGTPERAGVAPRVLQALETVVSQTQDDE